MFSDPTFWVAVSFVLFLALAYWKGWRPIVAGLDKRNQ